MGRGERLLGAIVVAAITYFIRWSAGCQRFLMANRWIGNRHAVTTVMRGKLVAKSASTRASVSSRRCRSREPLPQRLLRLPSSPRAVAGASSVHDRPVATCPINGIAHGQLAF